VTASLSASLQRVQSGEHFPLTEPTSRIGRDPSCAVRIADRHASRVHAAITRRGDQFVLHDLSANGTWVNGVQIGTQHALTAGDKIRIAGERFVFMVSGETQPATETPASPLVSTAGIEVIPATHAPEPATEWTGFPRPVPVHPALHWIRVVVAMILGLGFLLLVLHWFS
jgi:pSer/pThr/pTyr-binding forkhead associated (FHA) protein